MATCKIKLKYINYTSPPTIHPVPHKLGHKMKQIQYYKVTQNPFSPLNADKKEGIKVSPNLPNHPLGPESSLLGMNMKQHY
jgi:hypothetical protein